MKPLSNVAPARATTSNVPGRYYLTYVEIEGHIDMAFMRELMLLLEKNEKLLNRRDASRATMLKEIRREA